MTSGNEIQSWKQSEPSSLLVLEYAAALIRVTLRGFQGFTGGTGFERSRTESRSFRSGADNRNVSTEGELLDSNCEVLLRVSALHYSARDRVSEGFRTVASAHALGQPTSCGSKYFYNQCPQVQNLIGTEHSLNRSECRVKRKAS